MKYLSLLLVSALVAGMGVACGGEPDRAADGRAIEKAKCDKTPGDEIIVSDQSQRPAWIDSPIFVGQLNDTKYALFYGTGQGKERQSAIENANGDAKAKLAEGLKTVVLSQFARVWETYGTADEEQREQITKGLQAYKSKVEISGLEQLAVYVQKIQVIKNVNMDSCEVLESSYRHEATSMQGVEYSHYQRLRSKYLDGYKEEEGPKLNETQKRLLKEAETALSGLDSEAGATLPTANLG